MRYIPIVLMPLLAAGCTTQVPAIRQSAAPELIAVVAPTKLVETRYEVRSYREAANPAIRHEAHAVYRHTRVPAAESENLETVPRDSFQPVSVAPLPASAELAAELATQVRITTELRAIQASMAETEQRMQAQYALLVRQSAEALKLREQLEAERNRIRTALPAETAPGTPAAVTGGTTEAKW